MEKLELSVYGNGVEGLTSRVKGLEDELREVTRWMNGWKETTNYEDYKTMKRNLDDVTKKVYMTGALLAVLMSVLKIIPPDILQHIFK